MTRRAPLLAVAAAVVISLLAWFFAIQPQQDRRAELEAETEQIVAQQQRQRLEIARLEEIKANELRMRAALAKLEQYIPAGPGQPSTIRQLQLAADASGVEITSLTFGDPVQSVGAPPASTPGTVLAEISMTMTVEGGYFQGTDFLRRLESDLPRAIMVDGVSVTEGTSPAAFPVLAFNLVGRVFATVPVEALPGGVVAPVPTPDPNQPNADGATTEPEAAA